MKLPKMKFKALRLQVLLSLIVLLCVGAASASSLQLAKTQGLIGERQDGYLGYMVKPAAQQTKILVKDVNGKRRSKFQSTAKNNGLTVQDVAKLFFQRALKASKAGNFIQANDGSWQKKQGNTQ